MKYIYLMIIALIYSIVLNISYFTKKHLKTSENKYYSRLLVLNLIGLILEIICGIIGKLLPDNALISQLFTKLFMCFLTLFTLTISIYIYSLCFEKKENTFNKIKKIFHIASFFICTIIFILPINTSTGYATGLSCDFVYNIGTILITISIISIFICHKTLNIQKILPFLIFTLFNIIIVFIQRINPSITLTTCMESIVVFIMYFTIENPDLKIIEELTKVQSITEKSNAEKNEFIFNITDDIQDKLNKLDTLYQNILTKNPSEEIKEDLSKIKILVDTARNKIRNTIDVSKLDIRNLKTIDNKYNPKLLLESTYTSYKQKNTKNIDLRINLSENLPNELYGDKLKIKQIVSTLLANSIKYTEKGYIEIRVNSIIKSDICRLIIVVEDTGTGINIFKQKEILNNHDELTKEEIQNKDNLELNLKMIRKIINIIGGTFIIESNGNQGTKITITIDQKIDKTNILEREELIKFKNDYNNIKIGAIISENKKNIDTIKSIMKKNNIKIYAYTMTKACLDDIRKQEKIDYIVIDEKMDKIDAKTFLNKTKQIPTFKGKIFVITKNKNVSHKKELHEHGFDAVLLEPLNKKEISKNFK